MISFLYYFIGEYRLMLLFINCSLGAVSIVLIYLVSREIYNRKVALASTLLFAFWPSIFLWSTQNLKEPVTVFIILVVFWAIINLRKNINQFSYWIALLASFIFMFKIRSMFAVILFFVLAVALLPVLFSKKMRCNLFLVLAISVPLMIINWPAIDSFLHHHLRLPGETIFASLNYAHSVRTWAAETAFLVDVDISSPLKFMYHLPSFLAYVLFSPFPWAVSKVRHLFGTMEMSIWMVLVVFAGKGLFVTIRYKLKEALFMLVFLGIILLSFFGEGNVGTLFRHRALIWPCWHMLIAAGLFYHLKQEPESIS